MATKLETQASTLPTDSGVYLFRNRADKVIYVGKANNLRARVRQYLSGHDGRQMVPHLVRKSDRVEVIVTETAKEALLLENTLIKKYRPRFNVRLRDDSNYLHLRLDLASKWPMYQVVRQSADDGARYFGPYSSAQKARGTLQFLQRVFPLRTCSDAVLRSRSRPCLLHQMGRCVAPCVDLVTPDAYQQLARDSTALLEGKTKKLIRTLELQMRQRAEEEAFEEAARLRDLVRAIHATVERQNVIDARRSDRDVWGMHRDGYGLAIAVLPMREGVLGEPLVKIITSTVETDEELLSSAINVAYSEGMPIPAEILVPVVPDEHETLEAVLTERLGKKVRIITPQRGRKVELVTMAARNARVRFEAQSDADIRREEALRQVGEIVGLNTRPTRMECFDNSHLSGSEPVAAMAVFIDGQPDRREYRRYKIKTAAGGDDYAGMHEIITRRFKRALESDSFPDLLVIDGGKGQVSVAVAALQDLGIHHQAVVGIVKPRTEHARGARHATDRLVLPHVKDPIRLPKHHPGLRMLQHLRDETHRTAVQYQRRTRRKSTLTSVLDGIPGVGPARRKALIKHLGSVQEIVRADLEALMSVPGVGPDLATQIYRALHPDE